LLTRQTDSDDTVRLDGKPFQIVGNAMPAELQDATTRLDRRVNASLGVRFRERYRNLAERCCR
jgi:hypothetical protein